MENDLNMLAQPQGGAVQLGAGIVAREEFSPCCGLTVGPNLDVIIDDTNWNRSRVVTRAPRVDKHSIAKAKPPVVDATANNVPVIWVPIIQVSARQRRAGMRTSIVQSKDFVAHPVQTDRLVIHDHASPFTIFEFRKGADHLKTTHPGSFVLSLRETRHSDKPLGFKERDPRRYSHLGSRIYNTI